MKALFFRKPGFSLLLAAGLLLVVLTPLAVTRADVPDTGILCASGGPEFFLQTATGHISTPDGNSILMWSYTSNPGSFQLPGPVLCVNQGQTVTVHLANNALSEPVSIIFPGQNGVMASGGSCPSPDDCLLSGKAAASGETVTYTFTASQPGTYLYESGTNPTKQVQMGLYGALIVRPTMGADFAYNHPSSRFNPVREYLIMLSEIDPNFHRAVELNKPYDLNALNDDYWTINGRSFPDTIAPNGVSWLPTQPYGALVRVEPYDPVSNPYPALIRYINAGIFNHPFHPHGNHLRVIARDGRLLRGPSDEDISFEDFTRTIGSGQTYDLLFSWDDVEAWYSPGTPLPVELPGLQNLVFKDGVTFYSGSPFLGEKGEFPVGVTSYNECGEFYFPWHSHALFEFTNFDEGFGGMATILRVDPPGSCPAPTPGEMHVGDLDGSSISLNKTRWRATVTVTVHDTSHNPVPDAMVSGLWSAGDANGRTFACLTNSNGQCSVTSGRLLKSTDFNVTYTVTSLSHATLTYQPAANHDPDSDSDGTSITVSRP